LRAKNNKKDTLASLTVSSARLDPCNALAAQRQAGTEPNRFAIWRARVGEAHPDRNGAKRSEDRVRFSHARPVNTNTASSEKKQ